MRQVKEILELKQWLQSKYRDRNIAYSKLRQSYNADYWSGKEIQGIKLVYNLIAAAVDRYTDFMSIPPDWQVLPADLTDPMIAVADKQEKLLYSQYELNNISQIQQWQAHLQALLGFFCFEVRPHFGHPEKYVHIDVSVPDYVYPLAKSDNINDLEAVIIMGFDYNQSSRSLYDPSRNISAKEHQANTLKYFDENSIVVIKDGKEVNRIEHNFGFIPVVMGQNRIKPHFIEGTGDMDQSVGLNEYLNELISYEADIIEYAANPITIFKGVMGDVAKVETGPGSRVFLNADGDAKFLTWPGTAPTVENMLRRVQQAIEDMTFQGDALFARNIPSGTSGNAVRSFLSGIQATFLRKQANLGTAYVKLNEIIFRFMEKFHADKELVVRGTKKGNTFITKMKGSEINGNYRNRAIWPAGILDLPTRIDIETSKMNAKLQSKYTTMENIGILSPMDELTRIKFEIEEELQLQARAQNPGSPLGIDQQKMGQFKTAAKQIGLGDNHAGLENQGQQSPTQTLIQAVQQMPKIKGTVLFGGEKDGVYTLVLTILNDKATIVNKLPAPLKGKVQFRKFNEQTDHDPQPIVEEQGAPNAVPA